MMMLNKQHSRVISRLKRGDVLICGHVTGEDEKRFTRWWFEAPDMEVPPAVAASLLKAGKIEAQGDGLFAGDSQTYRKKKWARL